MQRPLYVQVAHIINEYVFLECLAAASTALQPTKQRRPFLLPLHHLLLSRSCSTARTHHLWATCLDLLPAGYAAPAVHAAQRCSGVWHH